MNFDTYDQFAGFSFEMTLDNNLAYNNVDNNQAYNDNYIYDNSFGAPTPYVRADSQVEASFKEPHEDGSPTAPAPVQGRAYDGAEG